MTSSDLLAQRLRQIAERDVGGDVDCWPAVRARVAGRRRARPVRAWAWGLAAAALLVAVLHSPLPGLSGSAAEVSAAEVLNRAGAASNGAPGGQVRSYHLVATRTDVLPSGQSAATGLEVWFGGGGRYREELRWPDQTTVTGTDGAEGWIYLTVNGRTYAAKGVSLSSRKELVPSGQSDLATLLAEMSQRACGPASRQGDATVLGRATYVVRVSGQAKPCPAETPGSGSTSKPGPPPGRADLSKASANREGAVSYDATFWIDAATFVVLRSEVSGLKGTQRYEVSRIDYDPPLAPTLFAFAPPPDAKVFDSVQGMKQQVAADMPASPKPPSK
jgi:outer membrane lipoprotein-sorting protein